MRGDGGVGKQGGDACWYVLFYANLRERQRTAILFSWPGRAVALSRLFPFSLFPFPFFPFPFFPSDGQAFFGLFRWLAFTFIRGKSI